MEKSEIKGQCEHLTVWRGRCPLTLTFGILRKGRVQGTVKNSVLGEGKDSTTMILVSLSEIGAGWHID